jgi:hypothetical protein
MPSLFPFSDLFVWEDELSSLPVLAHSYAGSRQVNPAVAGQSIFRP